MLSALSALSDLSALSALSVLSALSTLSAERDKEESCVRLTRPPFTPARYPLSRNLLLSPAVPYRCLCSLPISGRCCARFSLRRR